MLGILKGRGSSGLASSSPNSNSNSSSNSNSNSNSNSKVDVVVRTKNGGNKKQLRCKEKKKNSPDRFKSARKRHGKGSSASAQAASAGETVEEKCRKLVRAEDDATRLMLTLAQDSMPRDWLLALLPPYPLVNEIHESLRDAQVKVEIANEARGKNQRMVRVAKPTNNNGAGGKVKAICPCGSNAYSKTSRWYGPCDFVWTAVSRKANGNCNKPHWQTIKMKPHSSSCPWSRSSAPQKSRKSAMSVVSKTSAITKELLKPQYPSVGTSSESLSMLRLKMQVANDARNRNQRVCTHTKTSFIALCPLGHPEYGANSPLHGTCQFRFSAKLKKSKDTPKSEMRWVVVECTPHNCDWCPRPHCRKRALKRSKAALIDRNGSLFVSAQTSSKSKKALSSIDDRPPAEAQLLESTKATLPAEAHVKRKRHKKNKKLDSPQCDFSNKLV